MVMPYPYDNRVAHALSVPCSQSCEHSCVNRCVNTSCKQYRRQLSLTQQKESMLIINRRSFIGLMAANSAFLAAAKAAGKAAAKPSGKPNFTVGVGYNTDSYTAAATALSACGQFPTNLAGQTVVIKPNLVAPMPASSGATTDPLVVQAIVDLCI